MSDDYIDNEIRRAVDIFAPAFELTLLRKTERRFIVAAIAGGVGTYFGSTDPKNYVQNIAEVRDQMVKHFGTFIGDPPPADEHPQIMAADPDSALTAAQTALEILMSLDVIYPPEQAFIVGLGRAIEAYEKARHPLPSDKGTEKSNG